MEDKYIIEITKHTFGVSRDKGWRKSHCVVGHYSGLVEFGGTPSFTVWHNTTGDPKNPWYKIVVNINYDISKREWFGTGISLIEKELKEIDLVRQLMTT